MSYIITWWSGFIWSVLVWSLNQKWIKDIIIVDHLDDGEKRKNLINKSFVKYLDKQDFLQLLKDTWYVTKDDVVIHIWACSSTTQVDSWYLMENNTNYSFILFKQCQSVWARFIYASSAATYWDGNQGYSDSNFDLQPLNMYGYSKHLFDKWVLETTDDFKACSSQVVWLKFFNVYWPNEYHKNKMASVIYHWFNQICQNWKLTLFKSYKDWYEDWQQKRDFIYVKDIIKVINFFIDNPNKSGIFNLWTWEARTFNDLARAIFKALKIKSKIKYIDMPEMLKNKYQYYTQADISKLRQIWYKESFYSLEDWIQDYIDYLSNNLVIF